MVDTLKYLHKVADWRSRTLVRLCAQHQTDLILKSRGKIDALERIRAKQKRWRAWPNWWKKKLATGRYT